MAFPTTNSIVRVGVIGCGEISQVSHIDLLSDLSHLFQITYLCDVSQQALDFCSKKVSGSVPLITTDATQLCASENVDAVVVANATAFHTPHAILALNNKKHVLVEKPLTLCYRDIELLRAAEQASSTRVFVGYMRRYVSALKLAMAEVGDKSQIQYARVRDIIGDKAFFVDQSGKFPRRFSDISAADSAALNAANDDMYRHALLAEFGVPYNKETIRMLSILGGLGSHDLSLMREFIGMPRAVKAATLQRPIWSALLDYGSFPVVYESGMNQVPVFDAHVEIYTSKKIIRINYNTPYIKGLPQTVSIREKVEGPDGEASYQERVIRVTYEDAYVCEFLEWHNCIVAGRVPKTSVEDAEKDIDIIRMLMRASFSGAISLSKR